ncbi:uncharacterized protein L201_002654 [Kwoniella dendrophila CBS 6074]|uniref:GAR domain-containing protein n=1 Tax=Kwoniella dendrophila CBS 6074 TaxID=1295534 RepID=A0AAX4JT12_9TREE
MSAASDEELAWVIQHMSLNDNNQGERSSLPDIKLDVLTNEPQKGLVSPKHIQSSNSVKDQDIEEDTLSQPLISTSNEENAGDSAFQELEKRIHTLSHEVAVLLDRIYEIQELRHSSIPSVPPVSASSAPSAPFRIDDLLSSLSDSTLLLRPQITSLSYAISLHTGTHTKILQDGLEEITDDWKKVEDEQRLLLEEIKEDGWLIRFRTTADQAEAMIDPLEKSLKECQAYVEKINMSQTHVPLKAEFDDQLSIERLQRLAKVHGSITRTYVPSINKILKMMDKSISDRPIKNGESLRRFGEMSQRWISLQKQIQQLNAKIRIIVSQRENGASHINSEQGMELLTDGTSPYSSAESRSDYFGYGSTVKSRESTASSYATNRTRESSYGTSPGYTPSHPSSISSGVSTTSTRTSARQSLPHTHTSPSVHPPSSYTTLSPDTALRPLPLRRRTSMVSAISASTAKEKPRWNSSPKIPTEPVQTPTMDRKLGILPRSVSPTPSNTSVGSSISRRLSRIPIASPTSRGVSGYSSPSARSDFGTDQVSLPGLAVSNSHSRTLIAEPSSAIRNPRQSQTHLERARMGLKTPEPARPRLSSTFSSFPRPTTITSGSITPNPRTRTVSSGSIPRTAPTGTGSGGRMSLGGSKNGTSAAPPSSFRITSPTPSGNGRALSRPSSRLSVMSYSKFDVNSNDLKPFKPSKYDSLDIEIQKRLDETDFKLFVSRLDESLKRGQRKNENEEWKGEFLFGKSEKPCSVKLLSIAGQKPGQEKRVKCLIRVAGQWLDLKFELERRMRVYQDELEVEDDETF